MKHWTNDQHLSAALTGMQSLCILALVLGTGFAMLLGMFGIAALTFPLTEGNLGDVILIFLLGLIGLADVAVASVCSYMAVISFFRMCGRLKKERAFTDRNGRTLRFICRCCVIVCIVLGISALGMATLIALQSGEPSFLRAILDANGVMLTVYLFAFMYLGVGLACRALAGLLERAHALQDENDLII